MTYEWQQVAAIQYYLITGICKKKCFGVKVLECSWLTKIKECAINGLKANLINISQLCDQDLLVRFAKDKCIVLDQDQEQIMEGNSSSNNFYLLACPNTCRTRVQNDINLWHIHMGHVSHNSLRDTIATEAIKGVPKIKEELERMCRP